jgi:hypothetical protein
MNEKYSQGLERLLDERERLPSGHGGTQRPFESAVLAQRVKRRWCPVGLLDLGCLRGGVDERG